MKTTIALQKTVELIAARKDRSAWDKGVTVYALELLDDLANLRKVDIFRRTLPSCSSPAHCEKRCSTARRTGSNIAGADRRLSMTGI